jgi:hypothetical protein
VALDKDCWPTEQPIRSITISNHENVTNETYTIGKFGVTKIEQFTKPGEYCFLPYVRVWRGGDLIAEFCQHRIYGTYYAELESEDCF